MINRYVKLVNKIFNAICIFNIIINAMINRYVKLVNKIFNAISSSMIFNTICIVNIIINAMINQSVKLVNKIFDRTNMIHCVKSFTIFLNKDKTTTVQVKVFVKNKILLTK